MSLLYLAAPALALDNFALGSRTFGLGGAVAMGVAAALFDEPQLHCGAVEVPGFTEVTFHVAAVAPVEKTGVGTEDFEGGRGVIVFLDHVVKLGGAVFEAGGWVGGRDAGEPVVELARRYTGAAVVINLQCEVKQLGDILAGHGARENQRCPGDKCKFLSDLRGESVAGKSIFAFD